MHFDSKTLERLKKGRGGLQLVLDRLAFPLLALLSVDKSARLGFTPIDEERLRYVLKYCQGRLLDIGCGENVLVKAWGNGIGADVYPWPGADLIVENTARLPFDAGSFDSVSIVAALNHIPNRKDVLRECHRVLKPSGRIIVTMINPFVSVLTHKIRYKYDPDQSERGMKEGEVWGFWKKQVEGLLGEAGFTRIESESFVWWLNRVYVGYRS